MRLLIWLAIGLVIYFLYGRHHGPIQRYGLDPTPDTKLPPRPTFTDSED